MGILAYQGDEAVAWCACGPRSRYVSAGSLGTKSDGSERKDETTWFIPCLFVRGDYRGQGFTRVLIQAAVEVARREGASAIEGWPLAQAARRSADAFLGREQVFEELGFRCVQRPTPERVIMRLELSRS
jgi:GNAT superfamily N-acetyltransferase